jgi:hypothetical protein
VLRYLQPWCCLPCNRHVPAEPYLIRLRSVIGWLHPFSGTEEINVVGKLPNVIGGGSRGGDLDVWSCVFGESVPLSGRTYILGRPSLIFAVCGESST